MRIPRAGERVRFWESDRLTGDRRQVEALVVGREGNHLILTAASDSATMATPVREMDILEPVSPSGLRRYYVEACDNGGTLDPAPPRDRTWLVCDRTKPMEHGGCESVADFYTRKDARDLCRKLNGRPVWDTLTEGERTRIASAGTESKRRDFPHSDPVMARLWTLGLVHPIEFHGWWLTEFGKRVAAYGRAL